jgi:AraC-like DNA-binding protein
MLPTAYVSGAILCLISVIVCLITGSILALFSSRNRPALYLGLSYIAFGYAFIVAGLTYCHLIQYIPHLYRTGNFGWLLCMPFSWLYIRTAITRKPLSRWDLLHLLPVVVYLVDYFPFFLLPGAEKQTIIQNDVLNIDQLMRYNQGWLLPRNAQMPIRAVQTVVYWILQVHLLASPAASHLRKDHLWRRWMVLYNTLQVPMFFPTLIVLITGMREYFWASTIPPVTGALLSALTLFLYPRFLYSMRRADALPPGKPRTSFDPSFIKRLNIELEKIMKEEKPFLNPDYTLRDLAQALGVPLHKLSAFFNQASGKNFSDFLNQWRIRYCLQLIDEKKLENLNLHGIATRCGFNNRNTFSIAFKKVTGKTPSAHLHSIV